MWVIRERGSNRILGMSYSEEGLIWCNNLRGKLLVFKDAYLRHRGGEISIEGDTSKNELVYTERYKPRKYATRQEQNWEDKWKRVSSHKNYTNAVPEENGYISQWLNTPRHEIPTKRDSSDIFKMAGR